VNSNLYNRKAKLPDDLIKHLKQCAGSVSKEHKSDAGMQNQYLDSHEKNSFNLNDKHTTTVDNLKVENEIKRINKLIKIIN